MGNHYKPKKAVYMGNDTTSNVEFQTIIQKDLIPLSGVIHSFDIQLAQVYGMQEAIVIHHLLFWVKYNQNLKRNFIDGRTWTFQTMDEIAAHFPYLSRNQIVDILEKLCTGKSRKKKGDDLDFDPVIMKGNHNKSSYDRTIWYAFVDEEKWCRQIPKCILENDKMEFVKSQNGSCQKATPIPDTKTDINTNTPIPPKRGLRSLSIEKRKKWSLDNEESYKGQCGYARVEEDKFVIVSGSTEQVHYYKDRSDIFWKDRDL